MNIVATAVIVGIFFALGVIVGIITVIAMSVIPRPGSGGPGWFGAMRKPESPAPGPDRGPDPAWDPEQPYTWPDQDNSEEP